MQDNKRFSIEYIFRTVEMHNHAVGIHFIPTTMSYKKYPNGIVLTKISSPAKETSLKNVLEKTDTYGTIIGEGYDCQKPLLEDGIEEISFSTCDISEIESIAN